MPAPAKTTERKEVKLTLPVHRFSVDRGAGVLTDVALMTADREAEGHGLMIDARTLEGAKEAIDRRAGGQMRSAVTHGSWDEWMENGGDRVLSMPGWFEDIAVQGKKLVAGRYTFYDYFKKHEERAFDAIMEMAEKTPKLLGVSLELIGYAVYIGTDGTEYGAEPEDVELQYDGTPVLRVIEVYFGAFVDIPAANDGLFAALGAKLGSRRDGVKELAATLAELVKRLGAGGGGDGPEKTARHFLPFSEGNGAASALTTNSNQVIMLKKLKEKYGADKERLSRAMLHYAEDESLTLDQIEDKLREEDRQKEVADLRAENEQLKKAQAASEKMLTAEREKAQDAEQRLSTVTSLGGDPAAFSQKPPVDQPTHGKTGLTAKALAKLPPEKLALGVTTIDDLWIPSVWIQGMAERKPIRTSFLGSGAVVTNNVLTQAAQGGGISINVPFFHEPDVSDEPQQQGTGPSINALSSGLMIAPRLNRVVTLGADALSGGLSGADPISTALASFGALRDRNALRAIIAIMRGCFGDTAATGAFSALRTDQFDEDGAVPAGANLIDAEMIADASAKLGELKDLVTGGVMLVHPDIEAALQKQDLIDTIRSSEGNFLLRSYQGIPLLVSKLLGRAGTTSGKVYESYIFAPGTVGVGSKPQTNAVGEIASFTRKEDEHLNEVTFYDRTSGFIHPNGAKWVGTPANTKGGATNAELADEDNWELAFEDPENIGIIQIRTNG